MKDKLTKAPEDYTCEACRKDLSKGTDLWTYSRIDKDNKFYLHKICPPCKAVKDENEVLRGVIQAIFKIDRKAVIRAYKAAESRLRIVR